MVKLTGPHAVVVEAVANDSPYPVTVMPPAEADLPPGIQVRFGPEYLDVRTLPDGIARSWTIPAHREAALVLTYDLSCVPPSAPGGVMSQDAIRLRVRYLSVFSEQSVPLLTPIVIPTEVVPPLKAPQPTEWTGPYVPGDGPGSKRCYDFQH